MFLRVFVGILSLILYALVFFAAFMFVGLFGLIVLQAPWTALITGILAGLFAAWFARGLMGNIDEAFEPVAKTLVGGNTAPPDTSLPDTNPHDRLRRLSELRKEGHIGSEEYEAKRREILKEL